MFATLEQITSEEVKKLRNLALNPNRGDYVDRHGIPIDSNDIAYVIATPIQNSKRESGLEFSLTMWERTAHPRDVASSKKHMEVEKTNGSIHIGLHDDAGIQSIERFRYTLDSEIVSLQDFLDANSLLVGYIHPASEGVGSGIASIVIPPKQDSATGKVIRLYYGNASVASIQKGAGASYAIPEQYAAVRLNMSELVIATGWSQTKKRRFRDNSRIFTGSETYKTAPLADIVNKLVEFDLMTPKLHESLLDLARGIALTGHRGQRKRDNLDPQTSLPTVKYESILKYPDHAISDEPVIAEILGIKPATVKGGLYSKNPWMQTSPGTTTLGRLELYAHSRATNIVNKPREEAESQLEATLERLRDYESKNVHATATSPDLAPTTPPAAPEIIIKDYVPPEKYRNVNLSPGEITGALGLGRRTKKGFKFLREIAYIFSGETSARRAPFEKIIEALNKKGVLTDEVITNLEEIAETALSKDVSIAPRKNRIYHTVPDINNYESILKHPEAPLPDIKTIAYILGISPNGVKTNFFYFHPWSKKDGTLKALEIYLHFRAQNSRNKNASTLQLQLRWGLEKLQAYEDEKLSGIPLVVGAEPNIGAVATPRVTEDSAPAIIGTNGGALEQRVERFPVTGNVIPPAGEGKIEAAPPVKTVYYYSSSADSEFGRALVAGHIKEGTFIYHSTFNEVGTVKNLYYKDGMPNTISAVFTGNGQRILIVNLNEPDRFNIAPIPKGILLPNGEEYEGDGNDGLHPMDYILGREYNPTQIYRWISFGESKLDYNGILQVLAKEDILVPGPNGNYTGENLARFAIIREKDFFFRRLGYEGSKKEVLMNAGRDLDERVKGSSKRQL